MSWKKKFIKMLFGIMIIPYVSPYGNKKSSEVPIKLKLIII